MAIELGELIVSLKADASELYAQMERTKADVGTFGVEVEQLLSGVPIKGVDLPTLRPTVDFSQLHELNDLFAIKGRDHSILQKQFDEAPLTVKVNTSQVETLSQKLIAVRDFVSDKAVLDFLSNTGTSLNSGLQNLTKATKEIEASILSVNESTKEMVGTVDALVIKATDAATAIASITDLNISVDPAVTAQIEKLERFFEGQQRRRGRGVQVVDADEELLVSESVQQQTIESIEVLAQSIGGVFAKELEGSLGDIGKSNAFQAVFQLLTANVSSVVLGFSQGIGINFGKEVSEAITQEFDIDISAIVRNVRDEMVEMIPSDEIRQKLDLIKEEIKEFAGGIDVSLAQTPASPSASPPEKPPAPAANVPPNGPVPTIPSDSSFDGLKSRPIQDEIRELQSNAAKLREAVKRSELLINSFPEKGGFLGGAAQTAIPNLISEIDTLIGQEFGSKSGEQLIELKAQLAKLEKRVQDLGSQAFTESVTQRAQAVGKTFSSERKKARSTSLSDAERVRALQQIIDAKDAANASLEMLLKEVGPGIDQGTKKAIATARGQITRATKSAQSDIEGFDIGKDLVAGQNAGLASAIQEAEEMARQIARATTDAAKDENQIQSPSKVWAEMGKNLVAGQVQGMEQKAQDAYRSAEEIARTATEKAAAVQINDSAFQSETGRQVFGLGLKTGIQGRLPERDELRRSLLDIANSASQDFTENPIKAIQDGFARQEAFLRAYASATGRETAAIPQVIGDAFTETKEGRSLLKEALVNSAGLAGSVAAGPLGSVAGISADIGGALITRKVVSDLEAFKLAITEIEEESGDSIKGLELYRKALERAKQAMMKGREAAKEFGDDLFSDFAGGVVGNLSAEALSAAGSNVPLQGAAVAISSVGAIADARQAIEEGESFARASKGAVDAVLKNWVKLFKLPAQIVKAQDAAIDNANAQIKSNRDVALTNSGINPDQFDALIGDSADLSLAGENIVQSLAMGLTEDGEVTDAAIALASSLVIAFKDQLQIASPSKVFMRLGEFIVDGLKAGLASIQDIDIGGKIQNTIDEAQDSFDNFEFPSGDGIKQWAMNLKDMISGSTLASKALEGLKGAGGKLLAFFAGFKVIEFAATSLLEFGKNSIQVAIDFQRTTTALEFTLGSAQKASDAIAALREDSDRLGIDAQGSIQGFVQLAASAKGTGLEGAPIAAVESAASQASSVFQLTGEQSDRVTLALAQMSSKGKISSEELRQQLGEVLPGAFQIAARSIGVTTSELDKMLRNGEVLSDDFLPKFAQQLSAETASGVAGAAKTAQASINRFNNALAELQISAGEQLLPIRQVGLEVAASLMQSIVDVAPIAIQLLSAVALKVGGDLVVAGVKASGVIANLKAQFIGMNAAATSGSLVASLTGATKAALGFGKALVAAVGPYIAIFGAIESFNIARKSFSDLSGDVGGFAQEASRGFDAYIDAVMEARGANEEFANSLPTGRAQLSGSLFDDSLIGDILGADASRVLENTIQDTLAPVDIISRALGRDGIRSFAERQSEAQAIARDEFFTQVNETLSATYGPDVAGAIAEVTEVDSLLGDLQSQRRNTTSSAVKDSLGSQIEELIQRREVSANVIGSLQGSLATEQKLLESTIDELFERRSTSQIDQETFNRQLAIAEEQLRAVSERQADLTNSVEATVSAAARLSREFALINAQSEDIRVDGQIETARRNLQAALEGQLLGGQARQQIRGQAEIASIEQQIKQNRMESKKIADLLKDESVAEAFERVEFVDPSQGASEILARLENVKDTDEIGILREFASRSLQLKQLEADTIELDAQLVESGTNLNDQARDLAIQYRDLSEQISDFYRDALRSAEDVASQIVSQDFQNATQEISNEIRRELLGLEDSFVSGIGDTFTSLIESLRQPLLNELEAISQRNGIQRQFEDSLRGARDLQRQADEFDFNAGLGADPAAGLPTPQSLGQSIHDNFITDESGRRWPRVIELTPEQAFGGGSFLGEPSFENEPIDFSNRPTSTPLTPPTAIRNDDIAAANALAQRSRDEQLASIDRNLATQADTASVEAQGAIASIARQLEEGQRTIEEQSMNFARSLRSIGEGIGDANPLRELESGLLSVSDQFQDTNRDLEQFKRGLEDTIAEASTVREQLLSGIASGAIGQEALEILPGLDSTITQSQAALERADAQMIENRELLEAQRAQIIKDFEEAEADRREAAQRRIVEGRVEARAVRLQNFSSPFNLEEQRAKRRAEIANQAEQEAISVAFEFDSDVDGLDELLKTGELTKLEYSELKQNLVELNELKLDGIKQQFDDLRPTIDSITSALSAASGEFNKESFEGIEKQLETAVRAGALTRRQAREARSGLTRARDIAETKDDVGAVRALLREDNAFTGQFLQQLGRGDLVGIADLGRQNREAAQAQRDLSRLQTDPTELANELKRPELAQPNVDPLGAFSQSSDRLVGALDKLTRAITEGNSGGSGVTIERQEVTFSRDEESIERNAKKMFEKFLDTPIR